MNIGPQQIVQLIQVNEKLKEKVQSLEQDRLRFVTVMAEVKLSHQQEMQALAKKLAEQNLIGMLFGPAAMQRNNSSEKNEELEQSGEVDKSQDLRVSTGLRESSASIGDEQQRLLATEMQRLLDQKKEDDASIKDLNERLNRAINDLKQAHEFSEELEREVGRLNDQLEQRTHQDPVTNTQLLSSDLQMKAAKVQPTEPTGLKRQDSDLQEKSDLQDQLNRLLNKERQLQLELGNQLRQMNSLEEMMIVMRSQKDAEITNLRNQLEDSEKRYSVEITSIKQTMENSRHESTHQAEQLRKLIRSEENRETDIKHHLRQVFENRKDKINQNLRSNTYEDLANILCRIIRDLEKEYQPAPNPSQLHASSASVIK